MHQALDLFRVTYHISTECQERQLGLRAVYLHPKETGLNSDMANVRAHYSNAA